MSLDRGFQPSQPRTWTPRTSVLVTALIVSSLLVCGACGTGEPQPDDIVGVEVGSAGEVAGERRAQQAQSQTTTRATCRACGCVDTFFNCACATRKRLQCVLDGGPNKVLSFGAVSSTARGTLAR